MFPLLIRPQKAVQALYDQTYKLICLNDNQHIPNYDKVMQDIEDAFETILPDKSKFEL